MRNIILKYIIFVIILFLLLGLGYIYFSETDESLEDTNNQTNSPEKNVSNPSEEWCLENPGKCKG